MSDHEELMRDLKADHNRRMQAGHQVAVKLVFVAVRIAHILAKAIAQHGGAYMEIFLRYNFGVRYFPPLFALFTSAVLGGGIYFSIQTLVFSRGAAPEELFLAISVLAASILLAIPWTIHLVSTLRRSTDVTGQHSEHSGDAWLDDFNEWMQRREGTWFAWPKEALSWLCADELPRDFIGETLAGLLVALAVGGLCFDRDVTYLLLVSLALMQLKRVRRNYQKLREKREWNDAHQEMERQ